jgi:hypothetical protein
MAQTLYAHMNKRKKKKVGKWEWMSIVE